MTEPINLGRAEPAQIASGYVYLILAVSTQRYKIGRSINPDRRLKTLNLQSCYPLILLEQHFFEDSNFHERRIHRLLGEYRVHGEWFELPSWVVEHTKDWLHDPTCTKIARNKSSKTLIFRQGEDQPTVLSKEDNIRSSAPLPIKIPPTSPEIERAITLIGSVAIGAKLSKEKKAELRLLIGRVPTEKKEALFWKKSLKKSRC